MFSHHQLIKKLRGERYKGSRVQELLDKVSDHSLDVLFFNKKLSVLAESENELDSSLIIPLGVWVQIKKALEEVRVLEVDIPLVGRLSTKNDKIRKKINYLTNYVYSHLNEDGTTESEPRPYSAYPPEIQAKIDIKRKEIGRFVDLLLSYFYDRAILKVTREEKKAKKLIMDRVYVDPVLRKQVSDILNTEKLTMEGFIYQLKLISNYCLTPWFLVAIQLINEIHKAKDKPKITKEEFKNKLKDSGIRLIDALEN